MSQAHDQIAYRAMAGVTSGMFNENIIQACRAITGVTRPLHVNEAEILLLRGVTGSAQTSLVGLRAAKRALYGDTWPSAAFNFTLGGVSFSNLSTTRASAAYAETTSGVLTPFAANVPRITDKGLLVEEARTNKSTNYNAAPNGSLTNLTKSGDAAATLTEVDDTANLIAAGFGTLISQGVMNGKVFKLDNSAGVASAFVNVAGNAGNTNTHAVSAYVRGGTGTIGVQTGTSSSFTASATYNRRPHTGAGVATFGSFLRADAGQTIYFILNVFEEGAFVTSPIIIAGAAVTRAADVITLTGTAAAAALAAGGLMLSGITAPGAGTQVMWQVDDGTADNRVRILRDSSNRIRFVVTSGGVEQVNMDLGAVAANTAFKVAARWATNNFGASLNGAAETTDVSGSVPEGLTTARVGCDSASASQWGGYIKRLATFGTSNINTAALSA